MRGEPTDPDRGVLLEMGGPLSRTYGVRTTTHVLIRRPTGDVELYDLSTDPHQLDNRADDPALASIRRRLAARLDQLRDCKAATCR